MMSKTFQGATVFMSRNLVPPETFDSLHDALKHNGAEIFLCCDPSRNGPNDYHVISSNKHEKFDDLAKKGCNLLGPQCVLSCAKERRPLPKPGFTCCLAMDGVNVLASGFEMDEKSEIEKMVTAMKGVFHTKATLDVNFVIVKNVLAAKYKWALKVLKKPIVTLSWLQQCWEEHRVVPQESFRVLPMSGLRICVSRIPADKRKEVEKVVKQNGGKYSAELTKKCTHLICDAPEGDKYQVAKRWGSIHIVTMNWFDQCAARRVCLNEEAYTVHRSSRSSIKGIRPSLSGQNSQGKGFGNSQRAPSSITRDPTMESFLCPGITDLDLEATLSQKTSTACDYPVYVKEENEASAKEPGIDTSLDGCVADDSQSEDNDLYLSDCRILLVGFDASEMRKLVNMIRQGGGSRYMSSNEKLTHVIVGNPSETEKKEVRGIAAAGVISVVRTTWLEDCDRQKKEVPVKRHVAYDSLLPKDPAYPNKAATTGIAGMKLWKESSVPSIFTDDQLQGVKNLGPWISSGRSYEMKVDRHEKNPYGRKVKSLMPSQSNSFIAKDKDQQETPLDPCNEIEDTKLLGVFKGKLFRFSRSFPEERRAEIIEWVNEGAGEVVGDQTEGVHYTIECHGVVPNPNDVSGTTTVSSHWIRSCLEDGCLLKVDSHILYYPLPCRTPLPGFERFRFCVSHYDEKERKLLRNLCFVLGSKYADILTRRVTHLICKFTSGPKYEAACKWGLKSVTLEWIYECVKQNEVVPESEFGPKEATAQDHAAGLCTVSQYPSQATRMTSVDNASLFLSQSQDLDNIEAQAYNKSKSYREEPRPSSIIKRARISDDDSKKGLLSSESDRKDTIRRKTSSVDHIFQNIGEVSHAVPDVAAAIEDLLEQTSKIQDLKSAGRPECVKSLFTSDCSSIGKDHGDARPAFGLSKQWSSRADGKEDLSNQSNKRSVGMYDGFSETQTESQVVGYEEDLSGRQMIIDRVRTRSSMT